MKKRESNKKLMFGHCILLIWLSSFLMPTFGLAVDGFWSLHSKDAQALLYGYHCFMYALSLPFIALSQAAFFNTIAVLIALLPSYTVFSYLWTYYRGHHFYQLFEKKTVIINVFSVIYWGFWVFKYPEVLPKFGFFVWLFTTCFINVHLANKTTYFKLKKKSNA